MFVVIQKLQRKKPPRPGDYREYEVSNMTITFPDGRTKTVYSYYPRYEAGCFERNRREAFKISIHESHRENGKVVKKQCAIATIGYYGLADGFSLYDYIDSGIEKAAAVFGVDYETLYALVESRVQPLADRIVKEFHKTEEYKARRKREKLGKAYRKAKAAFAKKYNIDPGEYDACYDIFGVLREKAYLDEIIRQYEEQREAYRRYWDYGGSTYGGGSSSTAAVSGRFTDDEKETLRRFYRTLAKTYHPDLNPGKDTTAAMALLNRLKESWGV